MTCLLESFYAQPTLTVARSLLGKTLVRQLNGQQLSGTIVETEAYIGQNDTACHASKGRTPRTAVMFEQPGRAYVYLVYGMHHMLNVVTEADGFAAAVLIRAVSPLSGKDVMQHHRNGQTGAALTNGPAKLCRAMGITREQNRHNLTLGETLWIEDAPPIDDSLVAAGPRIGINYAEPKDRLAPWRFWMQNNPYVSR